jgi:deazaflavin-dependent oxidoreductase (nitroreductase family)
MGRVDRSADGQPKAFRPCGAHCTAPPLPQLAPHTSWPVGQPPDGLVVWPLGLPPKFQAALEVKGRKSGRRRSNPVVIVTVDGQRFLVSMLGPESDWVKNVEAAQGDAVIRQGHRRRVHLVAVSPEQRAPILREYVRVAVSGRRHFPLSVGAALADFEAIAGSYPVYRIDPY